VVNLCYRQQCKLYAVFFEKELKLIPTTRVGTLIMATIYLHLIQNRYMF